MAGGDHRPPRQMAGSPAVWPWASTLGLPVPWFPHPYEAMVRAPTPGTAVGLNEINV